MNRFASPAVDARMGTRLPELGLRLLLARVAAGLTAAFWLGAAAESSRHQLRASPRVPAHITLPTVGGDRTSRTREGIAQPDRGGHVAGLRQRAG